MVQELGEGQSPDWVIVAPTTSFDAEGESVWNGGPGGPDNVAWTVPPSVIDPGNGSIAATPQSVAGNWPGNKVAALQLTVVPDPDADILTITGNMGIITFTSNGGAEEAATFSISIGRSSDCPWDLDGDGDVGPADLAGLLGEWGPNQDSPIDFDGDGEVGPADLAQVLGNWGPCPE